MTAKAASRAALIRGQATISDVARHAGVSTMTVSRVLNKAPRVSPATRDSVERAIRDLNYVPNQAAKALSASRNMRKVAFLFDIPNAAVLGEMVSAGFAESIQPDVQLLFIKTNAGDDPLRALATIKDLDIRGVILSPPLCDDVRLRLILKESGARVVGIGCGDPDPAFSTIGIDDTRAVYELTSYLLKLGHRRIGLIAGHPRHQSSARRRAGYEAALLDHGIQPDPALQWEGDYTYGSAFGIAEQALALDPPPTAIFASNDDMAAAVLGVARGRGVAVPRALTVCGFDDSEVARMVTPQLTTIRQPVDAMAGWAVRQLTDELDAQARGEEAPVRKVLLDPIIIYRGSDAPPPRVRKSGVAQ